MVEMREVMGEFERLVKEMEGYVGEDIGLDTDTLALTSQVGLGLIGFNISKSFLLK